MSGKEVSVKFDNEFFAVLVRSCRVTGAIDTMLFGDVEMAKGYCEVRWNILSEHWYAYMVAPDAKSSMTLNGEGVRHCGWKHEQDETEMIHIHTERKVVEF